MKMTIPMPEAVPRWIPTGAAAVAVAGASLLWGTSAMAQESTHTVEQGDTVSALAVEYGSTVEAIAAANNLADASLIFPGQELVIPEVDATTPPADGTYMVQAGDTVAGIGAAFGVSVEAIADINGLTDPNFILPGQVLVIPEATADPGGNGDSEAVPTIYTLTQGETVSEVAQEFGVDTEAVLEVNDIDDATNIQTGTVLLIVDEAQVPGTYTVQDGDTLSEIAAAFGTTVNDIAEANDIDNVNLIFPGQELTISNGDANGDANGETNGEANGDANGEEVNDEIGDANGNETDGDNGDEEDESTQA